MLTFLARSTFIASGILFSFPLSFLSFLLPYWDRGRREKRFLFFFLLQTRFLQRQARQTGGRRTRHCTNEAVVSPVAAPFHSYQTHCHIKSASVTLDRSRAKSASISQSRPRANRHENQMGPVVRNAWETLKETDVEGGIWGGNGRSETKGPAREDNRVRARYRVKGLQSEARAPAWLLNQLYVISTFCPCFSRKVHSRTVSPARRGRKCR